MAYVPTDWNIDRVTKEIRYVGDDHNGASPSYASVIEAYRAWQDLADDLISSGDDELDMAETNPAVRSTDNIITLINGYNIDDNAAEHLYDGSIKQGSAGTEVVYAGVVNKGNALQIQIIQNGAIIADDWWNSNGGLNPTTGFSHRFMLKVRDAGADIDNRRVIATTRRFGFTFAEDNIPFAEEGNNVIALSETADLNNQTAIGTVAGWTGITNTNEGYIGIDVDNNGANEFYYSAWDLNTPTRKVNDFYERGKWLTRDGSAETLYGLPGEVFRGITHEIDVDNPSGTFNAFEPVSWPGGTGQMLAINSPTAGTKMYIQLLTGVAPTDNQEITGGTSGATVDVNTNIVSRTVSTPFVGASTGTNLIGAYGLGTQTDDVSNSDTLFDLTNSPVNPPNNVTNTVAGLVAGEDSIMVGPWDGVSFDINGDPELQKDQLSLQTALTADNITSVQISTSIPSDTPASGTIRVVDNAVRSRRLEYSSWSGDTFTISSTDGEEDFATENANASNDVYITYLDKKAAGPTESYTGVFNSTRDLVVLARDGGGTPIKQFISSWSFSGSDQTITVIRQSDE